MRSPFAIDPVDAAIRKAQESPADPVGMGIMLKYSEDQPRDDHGRFGEGGGSGHGGSDPSGHGAAEARATVSDHDKFGPSANTRVGDQIHQEWDGKQWSNVDPSKPSNGTRQTMTWDGKSWS